MLAAGAFAEPRRHRQAGGESARGQQHHQLLLMLEVGVEGIHAARLGGVGHRAAVGQGAAAGLGHALGGLKVARFVAGVGKLGHHDRHRRNAVTLHEEAPLLFAQGRADVDRQRRIVNVPRADDARRLGIRHFLELIHGRRREGLGVPVPAQRLAVPGKVPAIEPLDPRERLAVGRVDRQDMGEAAEEGGGQGFGAVEQIVAGAVGGFEIGGLFGGQDIVPGGADASGLLADDRPVEFLDAGGAALGADEERRIGGFDLVIEPHQVGIAAQAGVIEDRGGPGDGESAQGVDGLMPASAFALGQIHGYRPAHALVGGHGLSAFGLPPSAFSLRTSDYSLPVHTTASSRRGAQVRGRNDGALACPCA